MSGGEDGVSGVLADDGRGGGLGGGPGRECGREAEAEASAATSAVRVQARPGVHRVVLDRPEHGNALSLPMARELLVAIRAAEADASAHVLTLTGAGRLFCGGGDVQAMAAAEPAGRPAVLAELAAAASDVALALVRSRLLVVAGVNGTAAGAGLGLVLNADLVLVHEEATLLTAYSGVGLVPDTGVSWWLPRAVGPVRAAQLALGGRRLTGAEAVAWGLATEAVAGEGFDARLTALEDELAGGAVEAHAATKALLRGPQTVGYEEHLRRETAAIAEASGRAESVARVDAFARR